MSSGGGGALGSGHQLTVDREFRYIVQWFSEWSDFQREDFVPVMAAYLANGGAGTDSGGGGGGPAKSTPPYINGIIGGMANLSGQDKPMSLFQCRVKLFNEWSSKWPDAHRSKLLERLTELDATFGAQVHRELSGEPRTTPNPCSSDDPEEFGDPGSAENSMYYQQQLESQSSPEPTTTTTATTTIAPATIALVIAED